MPPTRKKKETKLKVPIVVEDGGRLPTYGSAGSAAVDLYAAETKLIHSGTVHRVRTKIKIALPKNYMAEVKGRSGLALKGLWVHNGVVDEDYRGDVSIIVTYIHKTSQGHHRINQGDRIAQLLIRPKQEFDWEEVEELESSERGENGWGSTGN